MTTLEGHKTVTLSAMAWALAVDKAAHAAPDTSGAYLESAGAATIAALPQELREPLERELFAAGITGGNGALSADWLAVISQAGAAPITGTVVSRHADTSTHCELNLFHGLGLAVEFSRTVRREPGGGTAVERVHNSVSVTLFPEENVWAVVAASLPDLRELTADGSGAAGLPPADSKRRVPAAALEELDAGAEATVHFALTAGRGPEDARQYQAAHIWILNDGLHEVKTVPGGAPDDPPGEAVLIRREPGAIALQLVWDVLGAHEFLSAATGSEAA
ncbi:hypothetical protein BIU82_15005 [Arthrobacter sp. SW1]|uniref:hypothetical protein n=1 Tax=Arthrobacter sp. SW1 TaxID=1920889 RepID=UPI000877E65E|nr:hypothetical protein [Arthrobacter sp. SW1]OFI39175.1 hypothetical protein BIU82_15005 [Arthrobacter sp. SW1]